jgi:hypothetical protein
MKRRSPKGVAVRATLEVSGERASNGNLSRKAASCVR